MTEENIKKILRNGNSSDKAEREIMYRREPGLKHLEDVKDSLRNKIDIIIRKGTNK